MMGFKSMDSACAMLGGTEMVHIMRKAQAKYASAQQLSLAEQLERLATGTPAGNDLIILPKA